MSSDTPDPASPTPVVLLGVSLEPGGAEKALVDLACGADRERWQPHVAVLRRGGEDGPRRRRLDDAGVPVHVLGGGRWSWPLASLRWMRLVRDLRPEVVHTFLFQAEWTSRVTRRLASVPVLVNGIRSAEWERPWRGRWARWTARLGLTDCEACVSNGVLAFRERIGIPRTLLVETPNGVDCAAEEARGDADRGRAALAAAFADAGGGGGNTPVGDSPVVLQASRVNRQKGADLLLDAAQDPTCGIDSWGGGARLVVAGDGPDRAALETRARRDPRTRDRVRFVGRRDDLPDLLAACDLVVSASRWEGMSQVLLEAMAHGRPIVATRAEGADELVGAGETGLLVPRHDPPALARAVDEALSDGARLRAWGEAGRARAETAFNHHLTLQRTWRLWEHLAAGRPAREFPPWLGPRSPGEDGDGAAHGSSDSSST